MDVYLKPFDLFQIDGHSFLFKIKSLMHQPVQPEDVEWLTAVSGQEMLSGMTEHQYAVLKRYRLIADQPWDQEAELQRLLDADQHLRAVSAIRLIELFVAQSCNMRCAYCYGSDGSYHQQQGLMSEETAKRAIDWLYAHNMDHPERASIVFFGGEPMLNFDVIQYSIRYAEERFGAGNITYGMATNMTLLTDEHLDFFAALPKMYLLASFDGPRDIHNRQRPLLDGRDSYAVCAERIAAALARGIRCTGRATIYADTDQQAVIREMKKLGLSSWQLKPVSGCASDGVQRNDASELYAQWLASVPDQVIAFMRAVKARDRLAADRLMDDKDLRNMIIEGANGARFSPDFMGCAASRTQAAVSAQGEVYPCHRFVGMPEFHLGNLYDGQLQIPWKELTQNKAAYNEECTRCSLRYGCKGECYYQCYTDGPERAGCRSVYAMPEHFCDFMRMRHYLQIYVCHMLDAEDKRWYFTREYRR